MLGVSGSEYDVGVGGTIPGTDWNFTFGYGSNIPAGTTRVTNPVTGQTSLAGISTNMLILVGLIGAAVVIVLATR